MVTGRVDANAVNTKGGVDFNRSDQQQLKAYNSQKAAEKVDQRTKSDRNKATKESIQKTLDQIHGMGRGCPLNC